MIHGSQIPMFPDLDPPWAEIADGVESAMLAYRPVALCRLQETPRAAVLLARGYQLNRQGRTQEALGVTILAIHSLQGVNSGAIAELPCVVPLL